jgi:hypothetical protein
MLTLIQETLEAHGVKCKRPADAGNSGDAAPLRLRIGGYDKRKVMFKGWIELEPFSYQGMAGSFCVMQRDVVCRSSFRSTKNITLTRNTKGKPHFVETAVERFDRSSCCGTTRVEKMKLICSIYTCRIFSFSFSFCFHRLSFAGVIRFLLSFSPSGIACNCRSTSSFGDE